ncbi:MAG: hypothetical protein EAY66_07190 [Sphingobacteriales bacterium]|nr:MAG: hypothetical protein EAY66_07190 [Sphingobacteriales bacterium]
MGGKKEVFLNLIYLLVVLATGFVFFALLLSVLCGKNNFRHRKRKDLRKAYCFCTQLILQKL